MPSNLHRALLPGILLASACPLAHALDTSARPPAYLDELILVDWQGKLLANALDELTVLIRKPVIRSTAVTALDQRTVTLGYQHTVPLREVLTLLERTQHLHVTVEEFSLQIETDEDHLLSSRRVVEINLRDYGAAFPLRDLEAEKPATLPAILEHPSGGIVCFANEHQPAERSGTETFTNYLNSLTSYGFELRDGHVAVMTVSPAEEAQIRAELLSMYHITVRHTDWRVTFGTIAADAAPAGGIVTRAAADALAARLTDAHALVLTSMNGQQVRVANRTDRAYVADVDIVAGHLDPAIALVSLGQSADLRAVTGFDSTWVHFNLWWTIPLPDGPGTELHAAGALVPLDDATVTLTKDEKGPVTATVTTPAPQTTSTGDALVLAHPSVWTWGPQGECHLPPGSAMVFLAEHPAGRAVIILEETTP